MENKLKTIWIEQFKQTMFECGRAVRTRCEQKISKEGVRKVLLPEIRSLKQGRTREEFLQIYT